MDRERYKQSLSLTIKPNDFSNLNGHVMLISDQNKEEKHYEKITDV